MASMEETFGPVISTYTRAQALEDGELVDVSELAREAGFRWPVAVTRHVHAELVTPSEKARKAGQSENGRLWDVFSVLMLKVRLGADGEHITFKIDTAGGERRRTHKLWAISGPGDNAEPVITIMYPEDY